MSSSLSMSYLDWVAVFKPAKNPHNPELGFDGCLFDTFGSEYDAAFKAAKVNKCWTVIEDDGDDPEDYKLTVTNGLRLVNRKGFLITEVAFTGDFLDVEYDQ